MRLWEPVSSMLRRVVNIANNNIAIKPKDSPSQAGVVIHINMA